VKRSRKLSLAVFCLTATEGRKGGGDLSALSAMKEATRHRDPCHRYIIRREGGKLKAKKLMRPLSFNWNCEKEAEKKRTISQCGYAGRGGESRESIPREGGFKKKGMPGHQKKPKPSGAPRIDRARKIKPVNPTVLTEGKQRKREKGATNAESST